MKKMQWLVMVMLVSGSVFGQGTNVWKIAEKYDRKVDGWVKGGASEGMFGIDKVSGEMMAPSALRIRLKNVNGEMEIKKTFKVPQAEQGKEIVVEALMGYNFVNKSEIGGNVAIFTATLVNRRGEKVSEKRLAKNSKGEGEFEGTSVDMAVNKFTFTSDETKDVVTIQVSLKVKVDPNLRRGPRNPIIAELWIKSLTIKEQE